MILVLYTTKYRLGGAEMERAAIQLAERRGGRAVRIESKREFLEAVAEGPIEELHFIGHSGLYGPMFGTTAFPEQMSRAEWKELEIPFAPGAEAYFHCCRSARWFAPYFGHRYGVVAHGHRSYTTFSSDPAIYRPLGEGEVHVVSVPGFKGMGIGGALKKRAGRGVVIPMTRFEPSTSGEEDRGYDDVAELYDAVFEDFRVREDEWRWISARIPEGARVLDVGCGNGAVLAALASLIDTGVGVDSSLPMLRRAERRAEANLRFVQIDGPQLPLEDGSVDVVLCILAWRYLDWDPMTEEIKRVLRPGGKLLMIDMVVSPFHPRAVGEVLRDKVRTTLAVARKPRFRRALRDLVDDPRWRMMLQHHPMRAQHEYRNYLPSRFPGVKIEVLNRAVRSEILAFEWSSPAAQVN